MSWQDDSLVILRALVNDTDETAPTYDDDRIEELTCVGAKQVVAELRLREKYSVDLDNVEISPDPTVGGDDSFMNLALLAARVIILSGEAKVAANQAIAIKDGPSAIDLKDIAKHKAKLAEDARKDYAAAKLEYQLGGGSDGYGGLPAGHAVVGPIRAYPAWQGPYGLGR
jgi:hypothetical protein